ncbi:MAG: hypothetical protein WEC33_06930, partial [Dehalococcoidia bacterium]
MAEGPDIAVEFAALGARHAVAVVDGRLPSVQGARLDAVLKAANCRDVHVIEGGEQAKSPEILLRTLTFLAGTELGKDGL